jgi:hypothetical protein
MMLLGIVFGNQNLLSQKDVSNRLPLIDPSAKVITPSVDKNDIKEPTSNIIVVDSLISDTVDVGKILRIIYKDTPGVFLTNEQELITLAKFQWKEIYKLQAQEFKYENYKLQLDLKDAYKERDRYENDLKESQEAQILMSKSYENIKSSLNNKIKENAVNESLKLQYKKESRLYKITTFALIGLTTYLVIRK